MVVTGSKVALAFGLNIAAGLSTCLGAIVILNKKLVHLANPSSLGIALGVAAGVMIFIALGEIFEESVQEFQDKFTVKEIKINCTVIDEEDCVKKTCNERCKGTSKLLATIFFIIGAALIFLMDWIVHLISPDADHELNIDESNALTEKLNESNSEHGQNAVNSQIPRAAKENLDQAVVHKRLNRTGVLTALAIGIHNIPEGIATYTGAMKSTKLGVALAAAIALHNIPEGIAVATPVYFATGSKVKAFLWTILSGLTEPLGGIIGWLIPGNGLNPFVNGVMFGLVVGMMVTISIKELIPTAYHFSLSKDRITYAILFGMGLMALSLILLDYAGV